MPAMGEVAEAAARLAELVVRSTGRLITRAW
jgi:hypothetical protein